MVDMEPPRVQRAQRNAGEGRGPQEKGDHRLRKSKGSGGRSSKALASLPRGVAGEQAAESSATAHPLPVPPSSGENDEPLQPLLRTHDSIGTTGCCGRLRHTCHRLVTWPPFDFFILAVIIASCITMATQSPLDAAASVGTPKAALYALVEDVYTYIFTAEVVAKLIAFGPSDYFGDGWNVFDFIVVSTAWLQRLQPTAGQLLGTPGLAQRLAYLANTVGKGGRVFAVADAANLQPQCLQLVVDGGWLRLVAAQHQVGLAG